MQKGMAALRDRALRMRLTHPIYVASQHLNARRKLMECIMSRNRTLAMIGGFVDLVGSAINVAGAVESKRAPRDLDLNRLGIDPAQFRKIRL